MTRFFTDFQYPPKEREAHFQNRWNRASIRFPFTESKCARFYRVSHASLASEDLCGRALGRPPHPREKIVPIIIT
jgi:hypothetical protein